MTSAAVIVTLAAIVLVLSTLYATGAKVLQDIPWHELEEFCQRRRRRDVFDSIHDNHEEVVVGIESVQIVASSSLVLVAILSVSSIVDWTMTGWLLRSSIVLGSAAVLLSVNVWLPRGFVRLWATPLLFHTWPLWSTSSRLCRPISYGAVLVKGLLARISGRTDKLSDEEALEDEIRAIVTEGLHDGLLEADTREMIEGVIELRDADVADIMTPRSKMDALSIDSNWTELMEEVIRFGRTRVPVYEKSLDNIIGILYAKDLLPELTKPNEANRRSLRGLLREARSVPLSRRLDELLQDFRQTRNHMAIVRDEYRAVAGLVTIEDVLEEIVGEIVDESDKEDLGEIRVINASTAELLGRAHVSEVNDQLSLGLLAPEEYDTIGGLIISRLGRIPLAGESIRTQNVRLTVVDATRRRVERVKLEVLPENQIEENQHSQHQQLARHVRQA